MSFNGNAAISMGMSGARLGGQLGGVWGAVGGGVLGLLAGGAQKDHQLAMSKKFNQQVAHQAAVDLFDMKRVRNIEDIRTARALAEYQSGKAVHRSTLAANIGAADIIGSSATVLQQTLDFKTQQAASMLEDNWEQGVDNYNRQIDTMTNQRAQSLHRDSSQQIDYGALITQGTQLYNTTFKGQGARMRQDIDNAITGITKPRSVSLAGYHDDILNTTQPKPTSLVGALRYAINV